MSFGSTLRMLRRKKQIGIRELSERFGYHRSYLSRVENDSVHPSDKFIRLVAKFFRVSEERLRITVGKLPRDISGILSNYPEEAASLLRDAFQEDSNNGYRAHFGVFDNGKAINSPFRYAGGKFYARRLILAHLPPHRMYIEPFVGGGSVFFAKPRAHENWLNDIDEELMNCYEQIKNNPEKLIDFLKDSKASKQMHAYFKKGFIWSNNLERAGRWYYLNRTSYSGIMNMQNCFWGYGDKYSMRPENWPESIRRTSRKLQGVELTCDDFEQVIREAPNGSFLFIDPPYFNADQDKFYTHAFEQRDHYRLAQLLRTRGGDIKFLLTYDNSGEIRELYRWADRILEKEWNYTINRTDDQTRRTTRKGSRYKGREIFIMNYNDEQLNLFEELEGVRAGTGGSMI